MDRVTGMAKDQRETIANAAAMLDGMALELRMSNAIPPAYSVIPEPEVAAEHMRIKRVVAELYDIAGDESDHHPVATETTRLTRQDIIRMAKESGFNFDMGFGSAGFARVSNIKSFANRIVVDFLERTGQYVTNDASREAAIAEATAAVVKQRDELLTALELCASKLESQVARNPDLPEFYKDVVKQSFATIASEKGQPCKTCNGERGWEACASSTHYFWKECPDCVQQSAESETQAGLSITDETQTAVPAIVFYPAGSLGEHIESEGGAA